MQIAEFLQVLRAFVDNPDDVDIAKGNLVLQLRDDIVEATVHQKDGELFVVEDNMDSRAVPWLMRRVARLGFLADRILSNTIEPQYVIQPEASLADELSHVGSLEDKKVSNASEAIIGVLGRRPAGTSSILYLTSDAGEGKTTLINFVARRQAEAFKRKASDWLLVLPGP